MLKLDATQLVAIRNRATTYSPAPRTAAEADTGIESRDRYNLLNHVAWQEERIEALENALYEVADDAELTVNFARVAAKGNPESP